MPTLGTGLTPKTSPLVQGQLESITQQEQTLGERYGELSGRMEKTAEEREKTLAPMEAELQKQIAEPYPTRPHTELPQFKPEPIVNAKEYEALSYGLLAMAMLGGVASQGRWLEVGSSLNGALEGYLKGNLQNAQKRYEDYETQFKGAVAKEQQANKEFEDILTNKKLRLADQMNLYKIAAAKYDRQDALAAAQAKNYDAMWRSLESNKTALLKIMDHDELVRATLSANLGGGMVGDYSKTGEEYLATIPPENREIVKKLARYEIDPKSLSTRGGHREKLLSMASQYDPTYDQKTYNTQSAAINRFATGPQGNTTRSLNVAIEHMDTVQRLGSALANGNIPEFNKWSQKYAELIGRAAPTSFDAVKEIVADEVVKGVIGGAGALEDRRAAAEKIKRAASPQQLIGVLDSWRELLSGQLKGLERQYEGATGRKDFRDRYLTDRAREALGASATAQGKSGSLTNSKGWVRHTDANGNEAFVSPDGTQFEEVR